jgi:hypothetical protein
MFFHGDNKDVLAYLLASGFRGKVEARDNRCSGPSRRAR